VPEQEAQERTSNSPQMSGIASGSKSALRPYANKLNSSGKLKPKECKQNMKNNLCMFCGSQGSQGHKTADCKKHLGNAQGKAISVTTLPMPAADATTSKSQN
jgi:hypothetical protein